MLLWLFSASINLWTSCWKMFWKTVDSYPRIIKHFLIFVNFTSHTVRQETSAIVGNVRNTFWLENCRIHNKTFLRNLAQVIRVYGMTDWSKVATNFSEFLMTSGCLDFFCSQLTVISTQPQPHHLGFVDFTLVINVQQGWCKLSPQMSHCCYAASSSRRLHLQMSL